MTLVAATGVVVGATVHEVGIGTHCATNTFGTFTFLNCTESVESSREYVGKFEFASIVSHSDTDEGDIDV